MMRSNASNDQLKRVSCSRGHMISARGHIAQESTLLSSRGHTGLQTGLTTGLSCNAMPTHLCVRRRLWPWSWWRACQAACPLGK